MVNPSCVHGLGAVCVGRSLSDGLACYDLFFLSSGFFFIDFDVIFFPQQTFFFLSVKAPQR